MTTHTLGNWAYTTQDDWDGAHVADKHGRIIAECQGCDIPGAHGEVGTDEAKANARLIAAAPEMLEALKAIVVLAKDHGRMNLPQCAGMARAAIAKAEGNASKARGDA
jgi:hypothetical protein